MKVIDLKTEVRFELSSFLNIGCRIWIRPSSDELIVNYTVNEQKDRGWEEVGYGPVYNLLTGQLKETEEYKEAIQKAEKFLRLNDKELC